MAAAVLSTCGSAVVNQGAGVSSWQLAESIAFQGLAGQQQPQEGGSSQADVPFSNTAASTCTAAVSSAAQQRRPSRTGGAASPSP